LQKDEQIHPQGFLEVPTFSCPEEKHLSTLQVGIKHQLNQIVEF
jgi:hypothetical protein